MPLIADIQTWADNLELHVLPAMNLAISTEVQERVDDISELRALITAAQNTADGAVVSANTANNSIYQVGIDATTYTNFKIQQLRDELMTTVQTQADAIEFSVEENLAEYIDAQVTAAEAVANAKAAEMQAQYDLARDALDTLFGQHDGIVNTDLPITRAAAEAAKLATEQNAAIIDTIFEGFTYPSAMAGIDASFDAAGLAGTAKDLAEAAAIAASNSANSAVGSANLSVTKAGEAALSALAAAASVVRASTGSSKVVPSEMLDLNWSDSITGAPDTNTMDPVVVDNTGYVTVPSTDTADVIFMSQQALQWVQGQTYQITILARGASATTGIRVVIAQLDGSYNSVLTTYLTGQTITGTGEWELLKYQYTLPQAAVGTLQFRVGIQTLEAVAPDIDIDIQAILVEDISQQLAIEGFAEAAVNGMEQAAVSQSEAESAAAAAENHAVTAQAGSVAANTAASAAAGSATSAAASSTAAGTSATSAAGSATTATTAAGTATTKASQASVSATTAEGHAVSAQSSSVVAATALSEALKVSGATGFELGLAGWSSAILGNVPLTDPPYSVQVHRDRAYALRSETPGEQAFFYTERTYTLIPGRKYKLRASFCGRTTGAISNETQNVLAGVVCLDPNGATVGSNSGRNYYISQNITNSSNWNDFESGVFTLEAMRAESGKSTATMVRLVGVINRATTEANLWSVCGGIHLEDVTDVQEITATVTQTSSSLATTQGAIAGFQFLAQTGSGSGAGIEAVSITPAGGVTTNTILLHGDVIASGTLVASEVLVGDVGGNLIDSPSFLFGDFRGWYNVSAECQVLGKSSSGDNARKTMPARYAAFYPVSDTISNRIWCMQGIPCKGGDEFHLTYDYCGSGSTPTSTLLLVLRFTDADGNIAATYLDSQAVNSITWKTGTHGFTAPSTAVSVRYFYIERQLNTGDGGLYVTNIEMIRRRKGSILITNNSLSGAQMVTTQALVTNSAMIGSGLINNAHIINAQITNAKLGTAAVDTLKIQDEAVGVLTQVSTVRGNSNTSQTWAFSMPEDGDFIAMCHVFIDGGSFGDADIDMSFKAVANPISGGTVTVTAPGTLSSTNSDIVAGAKMFSVRSTQRKGQNFELVLTWNVKSVSNFTMPVTINVWRRFK